LAARVQEAAAPGTAFITENTLTPDPEASSNARRPATALEGDCRTVSLYKVLGESGAGSQLEARRWAGG